MTPDIDYIIRMLESGSIKHYTESGLSSEMFLAEGRTALEFVLDHHRRYGKLPDFSLVFPQSVPEPPTEPLSYYSDRIKDRFKKNVLGEGLGEAVREYEKGNPKESLHRLERTVRKISLAGDREVLIRSLLDPDFLASETTRYEDVSKLAGALDGIPTPWDFLNKGTRGIHGGELWIVAGKLKTGKTFLQLVMAIAALRAGKKVLFVSKEMSVQSIRRRFMAIYFGLPYGDFVSGRLATPVKAQWLSQLDQFQKSPPGNFYIGGSDSAKTVSDLELLVSDLKPDITFIDGTYMFHPGRTGSASRWEVTSGIVEQLHDLTQKAAQPIVASWQYNRSVKRGSETVSSDKIAFAYETAMYADVLLSITRSVTDESEKKAVLHLTESRECERLPSHMINFNLDTMNFDQIGPVKNAPMELDQDQGQYDS